MSEWRHDTRVALRRAVAESGEDSSETKLAALQFCTAHGIEPYWRYAVWSAFRPGYLGDAMDKPVEPHFEEEWQRVLRRFIDERG